MKGERDTTRRLTVSDFENPMFDQQKIRVKTNSPNGHIRGQMIKDLASDLRDEDSDFGEMNDDPMFNDIAEDMLGDELPEEKTERVIEGTTFTDQFNLVGFTYSLEDSKISIKNKDNQVLFEGYIYSPEEYEKALKKADKKQEKLTFGPQRK